MANRTVDLTEQNERFVEAGIEAGRFSDASEAVRAGLHLLERQAEEDEAKMEWLRGATREAFSALDRGEGIPLASADEVDALVDDAVAEGRARRATRA